MAFNTELFKIWCKWHVNTTLEILLTDWLVSDSTLVLKHFLSNFNISLTIRQLYALQSALFSDLATAKCCDRSPSFRCSVFAGPVTRNRILEIQTSGHNSAALDSVSAPRLQFSRWRFSAKTCKFSSCQDSATCDDLLSTMETCIGYDGCPLKKRNNKNYSYRNRKKNLFTNSPAADFPWYAFLSEPDIIRKHKKMKAKKLTFCLKTKKAAVM